MPTGVLDNSTVPTNDKVLNDHGLMARTWLDFQMWLKKRLIQLADGPQQVTQGQISIMGLTANDAGKIVWVTDYNHLLRWSGSAWAFAPGDIGSNYYVDGFAAAPNSVGWHLADGTVNVPYLKSDGTLGNQTLSSTANRWFRR